MIRALAVLVLIVVLAAAGLWFFEPAPRPSRTSPAPRSAPIPARPAVVPARACSRPEAFAAQAAANAMSLSTLPFDDFGRAEIGWEIYAPLVGQTVGAGTCPPGSPAFAAALAHWQAVQGLAGGGAMTAQTLDTLRVAWHARRPFVAATRAGECPAPPPADKLASATPEEAYGGKTVMLRAKALGSWREMLAAARAERPQIAADPRLLTLFSGFRDPADEASRCEDGGCGGPARARCSAHRTGLAADLYLGAAPGLRPESTDDANRLWQSRTPAYRWLVANAARFGWVNYPFEPWHWEWTGEAP